MTRQAWRWRHLTWITKTQNAVNPSINTFIYSLQVEAVQKHTSVMKAFFDIESRKEKMNSDQPDIDNTIWINITFFISCKMKMQTVMIVIQNCGIYLFDINIQTSTGLRQHRPTLLFSLHLYSITNPEASAAAVNSDRGVCWQRDGLIKIHHVKTTAGFLTPDSSAFPWHPNQGQQASSEFELYVASTDTCGSK